MTRHILIFFTALIALAGSLTAILATTSERDAMLRGYVDPTQTTDLPYRIPRFGVNADLTQYDETELQLHLKWMREAKVNWIRQIADWSQLEPEKGVYHWEDWDRIMAALEDYPEIRPVVVFMNTPEWARPDPIKTVKTAPPDDPADMAIFVRRFIERYGFQVDFYQVWDEPNLYAAWGETAPKPVDYVALLRELYTAIHGNDEGATVIAAGLAPTIETGPKNLNEMQYLEQMYALGAGDYMDAVAGKPYGFDLPPDDRRVERNVMNLSRFIALREIMVANGDGQKSLWASAWGWNALPEDWTGDASTWEDNTPQQQIDYTLDTLKRADREWSWLGGLLLWHWQPDAPPDDPLWGFAVINQTNRAKPLWEALVLRDTPENAHNGLYHPRSPYARYTGLWKFSDLGADIGWLETTDSKLEFDFSGTDLSVLLREDRYEAFLYATVDGEQANATPLDSNGNAYIFLRSPDLQPTLSNIAVSRDLSSGEHTLRMVADRGWDRWALAGFAVSDGNLAHPYNIQIALAQVAALIAGIAVLVTGWRLPWQQLLSPINGILNHLDSTGQFAISVVTSLALMAGMMLTWGDGTPALFRRDVLQMGILIGFSGGLVALEPGFVLTIIATLVLFVLIFNRLEWGIILTLFWVPFFLFPVELYLFAFPPAELFLLITASAWILRLLMAWGRDRQSANSAYPQNALYRTLQRLHLLDYALLLWLIAGLVALLWVDYRGPALTEIRTLFIEPVVFYAILRSLKPDSRLLLRLVNTLLAAALLVSVIGLFLYLRCELLQVCQAIIEAEGGSRRLASVYGSPNNVALFLGRMIPFALALILIPLNRIQQIITVFVLLIMLVAFVFTQSAGGYLLGIPAGVFTVLLLHYGRRAWLPVGGLIVIGSGAVALLTQISARFASLLDLSQGTNFFRLRVWESAINIITDHPLTGLGPDQFLYAFRGHYIRPDAIEDRDLSHPHNFLLDVWIRQGIVGVLIFIGLQLVFWRTAWHAWQQQKHDQIGRALVAGVMGSMANLLAHGLVDNSIFVFDLAFVFVFLLAAIVTLANARPIDAPSE